MMGMDGFSANDIGIVTPENSYKLSSRIAEQLFLCRIHELSSFDNSPSHLVLTAVSPVAQGNG
jgi:hypothetical protein